MLTGTESKRLNAWSVLPQAVRQHPKGVATTIWFAAWVAPLSIASWLNFGLTGGLLATLFIGGILGLAGLVTLKIACAGLGLCLGEESGDDQIQAAVGFSALPHLVVTTVAAVIGSEGQFGPVVISGAPGGLGLGFTAVYQLFQSLDSAKQAGLLWLVPLLLTLSSAAISIGAMRYMGANVVNATIVYSGLVFAASVLWAILGTALAFLLLMVAIMGFPAF